MHEATTIRTLRNAMDKAHSERARAAADIWHWLFSGKSSR
ncbi:hypothetical protein SuNHUV7_18230 (plasmid) [Pseudoseohaeicola sp. NH-UV-7]|jgi:hypothetical protein